MSGKKASLGITKQDHFEHENKTWQRSLDFVKQENAYLKTRLSVVTDSKEDKEFIKLAEYFQNQFLSKDEFINGLIVDINQQTHDIQLHINNAKMDKKISNRQENLRKQISYFESDFARLKNEFNQLITQFL